MAAHARCSVTRRQSLGVAWGGDHVVSGSWDHTVREWGRGDADLRHDALWRSTLSTASQLRQHACLPPHTTIEKFACGTLVQGLTLLCARVSFHTKAGSTLVRPDPSHADTSARACIYLVASARLRSGAPFVVSTVWSKEGIFCVVELDGDAAIVIMRGRALLHAPLAEFWQVAFRGPSVLVGAALRCKPCAGLRSRAQD